MTKKKITIGVLFIAFVLNLAAAIAFAWVVSYSIGHLDLADWGVTDTMLALVSARLVYVLVCHGVVKMDG